MGSPTWLIMFFLIGVDDKVVGAITMIDEVRDDAKATIETLHWMGIKTSILSGDKLEAAKAVAAKVGIDWNKVCHCIDLQHLQY